jgi:hypothetical protein
MPQANGTAKPSTDSGADGKGAAAGSADSDSSSKQPATAASKSTAKPSDPSFHAHSVHYRDLFAPSCEPILDFHTRRRDHRGLEEGVLDADGLLAHTDFDIDLSRTDADNDEHFAEYLARRETFEHHLKKLYERTPKLPLVPLPPDITYVRPFLSSTFKDFNEERNICKLRRTERDSH